MQDFSKLTWSSWWRHLNPGIDLANVQTCKEIIKITGHCPAPSYLTNMIHKALWECIKERLFGTTLHGTGLKIRITLVQMSLSLIINMCLYHDCALHPNIQYQRLLLNIWGWWPSRPANQRPGAQHVTRNWPIIALVSVSHWLRLGRAQLSSWRRPPVVTSELMFYLLRGRLLMLM